MLNFMLMAAKGGRTRKGATRKAPPPPKRKIPWWLWLIVPGLLAAFIFVLVKISSVTPQSASAPTIKPAPAVKPAPVQKATSEPKQEKVTKSADTKKETFEFYQILQDSEVDTSHVDAYHYTPRGEQDFYYMVQAASFRSNEEADRLRAKLILSGLEAAIRKTSGDNGVWYRVVVGPFDTRSAENRAQDKLVSMGIESYTYKVKKEQ